MYWGSPSWHPSALCPIMSRGRPQLFSISQCIWSRDTQAHCTAAIFKEQNEWTIRVRLSHSCPAHSRFYHLLSFKDTSTPPQVHGELLVCFSQRSQLCFRWKGIWTWEFRDILGTTVPLHSHVFDPNFDSRLPRQTVQAAPVTEALLFTRGLYFRQA